MENKSLKFITGNVKKFQEMKMLLKPLKLERVNVKLNEIQSLNAELVIKHKLQEAFKSHGGPFIIEDVSLYLECFDYKLPGPLIKWFLESLNTKGIYALAKKLKNPGVKVQATIALAENAENITFFKGQVQGKIVSPKGAYAFGFDEIVLPQGQKFTLSELKAKGNFKFSPRARAAAKLKKYLLTNSK